MKKIIIKISTVIQIVLLAPLKLPTKVMATLRYIALSLGIIEKVLEEENESQATEKDGNEDVE